MATKQELKKVAVATTKIDYLHFDGRRTDVLAAYAIDEIDWPVMPDLLGTVEDHFKESDPQYKDAIALAEEVSLLTRAYYMQFISFFWKNERDANTRRGVKVVHKKMCLVPHPFIDENTKKLLKIKEDNYERIIIKTRKRRPSSHRGQANM